MVLGVPLTIIQLFFNSNKSRKKVTILMAYIKIEKVNANITEKRNILMF